MSGDTVWKDGDMKIVRWCGGFMLYDTNPSKHLTMRNCGETASEDMREVEMLKEYARGYVKAKREFQ